MSQMIYDFDRNKMVGSNAKMGYLLSPDEMALVRHCVSCMRIKYKLDAIHELKMSHGSRGYAQWLYKQMLEMKRLYKALGEHRPRVYEKARYRR